MHSGIFSGDCRRSFERDRLRKGYVYDSVSLKVEGMFDVRKLYTFSSAQTSLAQKRRHKPPQIIIASNSIIQ